MGIVTKNLSRYIKEHGFNLSFISKSTGIPYPALYNSFCNDNRNRSLRDDELIKVCCFLKVDPRTFIDKPCGNKEENGKEA